MESMELAAHRLSATVELHRDSQAGEFCSGSLPGIRVHLDRLAVHGRRDPPESEAGNHRGNVTPRLVVCGMGTAPPRLPNPSCAWCVAAVGLLPRYPVRIVRGRGDPSSPQCGTRAAPAS